MKLAELQNNDSGIITKVRGRGAFRKRIMEMGFVKGKKITVVKNAPLKDPIEYRIMGYEISLRRSEASLIEVITQEEAKHNHGNFHGVFTEEILEKKAKEKGKEIHIALVGNPNSGKTSLFNFVTGSREHVGNYSGVTVDSKIARFSYKGYKFELVDLPGTYSLSAYSPEELYVRKHIFGEVPDLVINIVDASNLERNLYLTTQLIDMDIRVIIALNMYDELEKKGDKLDCHSLGKLIGIPIVPTVATKGKGIKDLFDKVINVYTDKDKTTRHVHINYGHDVETSILKIQDEIWKNKGLTDRVSSRFYAIKLLEKDKAAHFTLSRFENYHYINDIAEKEIKKLEDLYDEDSETLITDAKYGFIAGALKETYKHNHENKIAVSELIDSILTHRILGFPIFIFLMWFMFFTTFKLGQYPMDWIEKGVALMGNTISNIMHEGPLKDLLIDGIINGIGSVIVFLPNILILFFFISLFEDTGYMARAAFIMDKVMHKIGLHGKSFIPLLMGFGCNVPAIMASRTIENRNNRILTMLINPFMSCSARLPVYLLLIGAFFPAYQGSMLVLIYFIGVALAALVAITFKKIFFRFEDVPFVMELPPYRIPTLRSTTRHMWDKGAQYLKKMGGVILVAVIIIWSLGYFPRNVGYSKDYEKEIQQVEKKYAMILNNPEKNSGQLPQEQLLKKKKNEIKNITLSMQAEQQANSYLGRIGYFIEPVIKPLGFDWRMGISLLSGIAAKEIVVSTMGVIFQVDDDPNGDVKKLAEKLRDEEYQTGIYKGKKVFTPLIAFSFIMFILIYFPCVAVIAAIKKESDWKWAVFTIFYTTGLAWLVSFIIYQTGSLFN